MENASMQDRPNTTSSTTPLAPLGKLLNEFIEGFDFEEWQANRKARREKLKREFCAKYGLNSLTEQEFADLERAQIRLKDCVACSRNWCNKTTGKFRHPQITAQDGRVKVEMVLCDVWLKKCFAEQCQTFGIPTKYAGRTFADYKVTRENERAVKLAHWFLADERQKGLYFYGGAGTGKTFLASLIAREYILHSRSVVFGDVPFLLSELKRTFNTPEQSSEGLLDRYCNCDLLVLDDLGAGQVTEWNVGVLYQIINNRYNASKPLIITSNFDLDGLEEKFGKADALSAKRIISRLSEMCYQGFLGTLDRRRKS